MKATRLAQRYCSTLGLSSDASAEEIREAYYRLAFTHHPDRNPGDTYAAARFKEIQVAYEWLSQPRAAPPPTADQFPFLAPERSEAGLVWRRLAALAAVAALAITLTLLLRTTPRMGAAVKTESPGLEQLPDPSSIATQIPEPVNIPNEEFTAARHFLTAISPPDSSPVERSAAGSSEWLAESSVGSVLESVEWSPPVSFASTLNAALDAVCGGVFSAGSLTEAWYSSPTWQESMRHRLPIVPMSITWTAFDSPTQWTPVENDQQVVIESGMIRYGNRRPEPVSLDSEIASSALQSAAWQLEPDNDIPGKRSGEPQSLLHQHSQPIEHPMPQSFESVNRGDAQQPKKNSHSHILEVLRSTTIPTNRGDSNPAHFNPLERFSSEVSKDAWKPLELFPGQPKGSPERQEEKLLGHWPLHDTPHQRQSTDRANNAATAGVSNWGSTTTAGSSTWEANSRQKAWPQSGVAAGNAWGSGGSFNQNSIRSVDGDFSASGRGGAMANLGWNLQPASATNSNYADLTTRSEERINKSFLSPTASQIGHPIHILDQPSIDQSRWDTLPP